MRIHILSFFLFVVVVTTGYAASGSTIHEVQKELFVVDDYGNLVKLDPNNIGSGRNSVDVKDAVKFYLYTRSAANEEKLFVNNVERLKKSSFDPKRETKIITHGWLNSRNSPSCTTVKDAFLKLGDFNVIVVDWSQISKRPYGFATLHIIDVAKCVGKMIDFLADIGMDLNTTTVVGHSLGAHVVGLASYYSENKVNYVVGLDPALPLFNSNNTETSISMADARNVEIIHTNSGLLGFVEPVGKADFYPNGGRRQLGCGLDVSGSCSHNRAYEYFAESLISDEGFYGTRCPGKRTIHPELCNGEIGKMGGNKQRLPYEGIYYVATRDTAPFAMGRTLS